MLDFLKKEISFPLLKLTLPLILTNLVQSALPFFETIFLASLGEETLAAGGLVSWLYATIIVIIFGTFSAINVLVAHQYGAKNYSAISLILRDSLVLALLCTLPIFILLWFASNILLLLGQGKNLANLANIYLHALSWGLLPKFILIVLYEFVIGLGHSRVIMYATVFSIPLYIFFSYALIFGKFGLPALGIAGAGWGLTYSDWIITSTFLILLFKTKTYRPYLTAIFSKVKIQYLSEILQIGIPMGIMFCFEVAFFFAMTLLMGYVGTQILAANQIVMQYMGIFAGIMFCIAQAVTVQMGHFLGAKETLAARETAYAGVLMTVAFTFAVALIYWFVPKLLISVDFDVNDPKYSTTINTAITFFSVAAIFQIFESIRIALFGALRALKDTRYTLITSIIGFWLIALLLSYILIKYMSLQSVWVWWMMCLGAAVNALLLFNRLKSKLKYLQMRARTKSV